MNENNPAVSLAHTESKDMPVNSIYLGDIDPNNEIIAPVEIRRNFMHRLLIWDSIVLSDSQLLTDPRINLMMSGFDSKELAAKLDIDDIDDSLRGFEHLINGGFVEVAKREKNGEIFSLNRLYEEMLNRDSNVPYLPNEAAYSKYLDSLSVKDRLYDLDDIAGLFKSKLISGLGKNVKFMNNTLAENRIAELFFEDKVNFSKILENLKKMMYDGEITPEDYQRIYEYVYSCYSVNISEETGCYISTRFKNIPLHLGCGMGDFAEEVNQTDLEEMRPTWALTPEILDLISFEEFAKIKKEIEPFLSDGTIMEFFNGVNKKKDLPHLYDIWEKYTKHLEMCFRESLRRSQVEILMKLNDISGVKIRQRTILTGFWEWVENVIGSLPYIGEIVGMLGLTKSSLNYINTISHRGEWNRLVEQSAVIENYLSPDIRIITKYYEKESSL